MLLHCSDEPERWRIDAHGGVLYDLQAQRTAAYDRVAVPADGNCFYSALCAAACLSLPALALRRCIADTLEVHGDTIFPTVQQFADPIMTRTSYNDDVQLVRTAGRWNCALGDSLPLIVARHVLKCTIRIVTGECVLVFMGGNHGGQEEPILLHLRRSHYSYYRRRHGNGRHNDHPYLRAAGPRRYETIQSRGTKTQPPVDGASA